MIWCVYLIWGLLAVSTSPVESFFTPTADDIDCFTHDSACNTCIREPACQWCAESKRGNNSGHHCFSVHTNLSVICAEVENPRNTPVELLQDKHLTEGSGKPTDTARIVQLRPQHVKLKLRRGVAVNFTVSYRQVKDYPLDLYYLMDMSHSMKEDKDTIAALGKELAATMRNLTSQFKIGFGTFVDKKMLPFVNTHPKTLESPCIGCVSPFSFRNNLKLTEKDTLFTEQVKDAKLSSNLDSPEGGFDALMQAMVCEKEIGWRDNVRKIIILSTDASFHFAGDGKLAGVITPNDGECHLNAAGYYDKYDVYDYPSIGHINAVAQEKGINLIFAVKKKTNLYRELKKRIKDSFMGELDSSSKNVIEVVEKVYKGIRGKVEMDVKSNQHRNPVSIRFFTDCGESGAKVEEKHVCNNIKEGQKFDFTVEIMVSDCPDKGDRSTSISIGTLQDSVKVDVDLLCDCDCERSDHKGYEKDSQSCSNSGTKQCEVCICNPDRYGQQCQCSKDQSSSNVDSDNSQCRPEGSNATAAVCSGRGRCECQTCLCWKERHTGKFCHCDKGMCRQFINTKTECSGNGRCGCNSCECHPGWEGQFCQCRSKDQCIPTGGGEYCSGNGKCECGKCECDVPYTGKYCEECPSCEKGKCLEFRPCVQCEVWGTGPRMGEACKNCSLGKIPTLPSLRIPLKQYAVLCTFVDEHTGCDFNFTYKYLDEQYEIYAQNNQKCPEQANLLVVTFGVVAGIVAIGVLTLIIWKILTTLHDRREFRRFDLERKNAKWTVESNPLYQGATTTVANPAFSAK